MKIYNGEIAETFVSAEVSFSMALPEFCENVKFKLAELIDEQEVLIEDYSLILNNRSDIISTDDGTIFFSGTIIDPEVNTTVISQLKIETNDVELFSERAFILKVYL